MIIQICVGSSCHLKGSQEIIRLFQEALEKHDLAGDITLAGSFCTGQCNREGVTVQVEDTLYPGLTPENFNAFFAENVLKRAAAEGV